MAEIIIKKIRGRNRKFRKVDDFEFDEIGLKRKDFVERKTLAIPKSEGWFHIKKPVRVSSYKRKTKRVSSHRRSKPRSKR